MTDAHATIPADAEALLRQAAAWRLIGLLLECPGPDWMKQVLALGRDCDDPRLQSAAVAAQTEASEGLHHSLFGPGGPVSPREVTYSGGVQFGYLMAELNAFYRAFAYAPTTMEPLDHLSVEAGFMAYLGMKRAYALASGDTEHATRDAGGRVQLLLDPPGPHGGTDCAGARGRWPTVLGARRPGSLRTRRPLTESRPAAGRESERRRTSAERNEARVLRGPRRLKARVLRLGPRITAYDIDTRRSRTR